MFESDVSASSMGEKPVKLSSQGGAWEENLARQEEQEKCSYIVIDATDDDGRAHKLKAPKSLVYDVVRAMRNMDNKTRLNVCEFILFNDDTGMDTPESKAALRELGYKNCDLDFNRYSHVSLKDRTRDARDKVIRALVSPCVMVSPREGIIYNETVITSKLTPSERGMTYTTMDNIVAFKTLMGKIAEEAAIAARLMHLDKNPPAYAPVGPHLRPADVAPKGPTPLLRDVYAELGIAPDKMDKYFHHLRETQTTGKRPMPLFYFMEHIEGGLKSGTAPALQPV